MLVNAITRGARDVLQAMECWTMLDYPKYYPNP